MKIKPCNPPAQASRGSYSSSVGGQCSLLQVRLLNAALSCAGLNTGSVLIRNTDWSRALAEEMASYGKYPIDWGKEEAMRAALPSYDIGMYEQNMLVYTIMHDPTIMAKVCWPLPCMRWMCLQKLALAADKDFTFISADALRERLLYQLLVRLP